MTNPIPAVQRVYAAADDRRGHMCGACMNPHLRQGNPACKNAPRPPQVVPYLEEIEDPEPEYPPSKHARWWPA